MKALNLTGQRFGMLVALEPVQLYRRKYWRCKCDCGTVSVFEQGNLRAGRTQSCGCRQGKHGNPDIRKSKTYTTWARMRQRCNDPAAHNYKWYGARGIRVCERWNDYANFLADMGERPENGSIDRINPDGDYCPENCRWLDRRANSGRRRAHGGEKA